MASNFPDLQKNIIKVSLELLERAKQLWCKGATKQLLNSNSYIINLKETLHKRERERDAYRIEIFLQVLHKSTTKKRTFRTLIDIKETLGKYLPNSWDQYNIGQEGIEAQKNIDLYRMSCLQSCVALLKVHPQLLLEYNHKISCL